MDRSTALKLSRNRRGELEGLPVELMVISVVMLLSIPLIWTFADMYVEEQTEENLKRELKRLRKEIQDIQSLDPGNQRTITLDFDDHPMAQLDYVMLGGDDLSEQAAVRYRFRGEPEKRFDLGDSLATNFTEKGPRELSLPMDGTDISLRNVMHDGYWIVEVGL